MKIILTGATGLIGSEVLTQCLANPAVTSITTLARRTVPLQHPKLTQISHTDFTTYPPALLSSLADADACIFALGLAMPKTPEDGKRINQDFPLAAARAFSENAHASGKKFRFVYVSGVLVEKDQERKLWVLGDGRKMRGRTELELLKLNGDGKAEGPGGTEVKIVRPGFVGSKGVSVKNVVVGAFMKVIKVDALARAIVDLAVNGAEGGKELVEMDELIALGKAGS